MKILVLGADGYLGWPTCMNLAYRGHEVLAVDNYLKRRLLIENNISFLGSPESLENRVLIWNEKNSSTIKMSVGDLSEWEFVVSLFSKFKPDCIIHYAEQPSAPYSMKDTGSAGLTLSNNLKVTFNIAHAIMHFCPEAHLVKLGTMGEYGTPNIDIEEGWLEISHKGRSDKFLYPRQASSLYHTTKIMDTDLLWFYVRNNGLRVTDLMQGPVYGVFTKESEKEKGLLTGFCYDQIFGTVLNRFIVQAVCGYPLTVYGKGNQTRGYLNILDTIECVNLCVENPSGTGELRILNQFTETFSVNELANKVCAAAESLGITSTIKHIQNPRNEKEDHYYNPENTGLKELGLKPTYLTSQVLEEMIEYVRSESDSIKKSQIIIENRKNIYL